MEWLCATRTGRDERFDEWKWWKEDDRGTTRSLQNGRLNYGDIIFIYVRSPIFEEEDLCDSVAERFKSRVSHDTIRFNWPGHGISDVLGN